MKKIWFLILSAVLVLGVTGCASKEAKKDEIQKEELSFNNLKEAMDYYYNKINSSTDSNEKKEYENKLNEYILNDLNGFYYYRGTKTEIKKYTYPSLRYKAVVVDDMFDNRAIYVKNKDEVYIAPYGEEELKDMGYKLEDLPKLENSDLYKYRITDLHTEYDKAAAFEYKYAYVTFESIKVNNSSTVAEFNEIKMNYSYEKNDTGEALNYYFSGFFADLTKEENQYNSNTKPAIQSGRAYYRDEQEAIGYNLQEKAEDEEADNKSEALKNSKPSVGMTADEVKKSKWGYPDKINKDTYSWGTKEQWVYDDHGYVYLENGVVTSVSER